MYTRYLKGLDRPLNLLATVCKAISGICLIILVATFGWLVFGRYVLNSTPTWVEQLALLLIVVITFFSASVGVKERSHLSVEILPYMLRPVWRAWLHILLDLVLAVFGCVMMIEAYKLTAFNWTTMIPLLNIPESFRTFPVAVSGGLILLFCLGNILHKLAGLIEGDVDEPEKFEAVDPDAASNLTMKDDGGAPAQSI